MILGDKISFAIEFDVLSSDPPYGEIILWLQGKRFGDGEATYIKRVLLTLEELEDLSNIKVLDVDLHEPKKILDKVLRSEDLHDQTLIQLGPGFDSYVYRAYFYKMEAIFLWSFIKDRAIKFDIRRAVVESGRVNKLEYEKVIKMCLDYLAKNAQI